MCWTEVLAWFLMHGTGVSGLVTCRHFVNKTTMLSLRLFTDCISLHLFLVSLKPSLGLSTSFWEWFIWKSHVQVSPWQFHTISRVKWSLSQALGDYVYSPTQDQKVMIPPNVHLHLPPHTYITLNLREPWTDLSGQKEAPLSGASLEPEGESSRQNEEMTLVKGYREIWGYT